jgi:hypothetical protein
MNLLFEIYAFSYPISTAIPARFVATGIKVGRLKMLITSAITLLCTAGIAFYLRFLLALCRECKPRWLAFSKHLRLFSGSYAVPKLPVPAKRAARGAAIGFVEINLNTLFEESRKDSL